jgi:hypothetical protein
MNVVTRRKVRLPANGPAGSFGSSSRMPEGFRYSADLLTPVEEESLARELAGLPFKPFDFHGYQANRQVVGFGFRYDYGQRQVVEAPSLPSFLKPLRDKIAEAFHRPAEAFRQVLVNEYRPGRGVASEPLHLPLSTEIGQRLGSHLAHGRAALRLSALRTVTHGLGAQHSAGRPPALFDHVSDAGCGTNLSWLRR